MRTRTEIEEQLVRDISSCQTEAAMATTIQELSLHVLLDIRELLPMTIAGLLLVL